MGDSIQGEASTLDLFIQDVVDRFYKMEKIEPGWNHYDLTHLLWLFNYYHSGFEDTFYSLLSCKDWQGLNNYYYQTNRLNIFPTYISYIDPPSGSFFEVLKAIAVGDDKSVEHLFPSDRTLKKYKEIEKGEYPLKRVGEVLLAGIWYQDSALLEYAIPRAEKFVVGKWPKWEIAAIAYLLALQAHDVAKASEYLEDSCKVVHTGFEPVEKKLFVYAQGVYQLAKRVLDEDMFQKLSMPEYKTFSKEYARWRNSHLELPQLYISFPEPVSFLNDLLTADYRTVPWAGYYPSYPLPAGWLD